jgi:hypothetical protein
MIYLSIAILLICLGTLATAKRTERLLRRGFAQLRSNINTHLATTEKQLMKTLADINASVQAETTVEQSAITLMTSLSQQLKDALATQDPAAIQAIIDQLDNNNAALAAAVVANTPAAPPAATASETGTTTA